MVFFPYQADLSLRRPPLLTILVCLACLYIFYLQLVSASRYGNAIQHFCINLHSQIEQERMLKSVTKNVTHNDLGQVCPQMLLEIREAPNAGNRIDQLAANAIPLTLFKPDDERAYIAGHIEEAYWRFEQQVPQDLTESLVYAPDEMQWLKMITSSFSHGSWSHVIFNLIFFFAFAAAIEILLGSLGFIAVFLAMAAACSLTYSLTTASALNALPTLGLSGVVVGMMALLTVLMPSTKIRCFFWFIVIFRRPLVAAWLLAIWYIGGDILNLLYDDGSAGINFVAHVSGAATGALIGFVMQLFARETLQARIENSTA